MLEFTSRCMQMRIRARACSPCVESQYFVDEMLSTRYGGFTLGLVSEMMGSLISMTRANYSVTGRVGCRTGELQC